MDSTEAISQEGVNSTWLERLLATLLSYSIILGPIAIIVLATRYKLLPEWLRSNALVQWFVYGRSAPVERTTRISLTSKLKTIEEDQEQLLDEHMKGSHMSPKRHNQPDAFDSNSTLTFIWCLLGLQLSYLAWGVLQEKIMTTEYVISQPDIRNINATEQVTNLKSPIIGTKQVITFHDSQFLVFMNRTIAFILSALALVYQRPRKTPLYLNSRKLIKVEPQKPQPPLYEYIYCSLSNILSSWCQYEALKYVNFPTQVLSKSCKIIPVMLMSKLMHKKKYQYVDYLCAFLLSVGMFIFLMNQSSTRQDHHNPIDGDKTKPMTMTTDDLGQPQSDSYRLNELGKQLRSSSLASGLIILSLYLAFDSFTSNWQQSLFSNYGISNWQMMAASNFYSILLTLVSLHQLGTLGPAFKLLSRSSRLLSDCLLMSITSSIGQIFVFYTIKRFGSVLFAVIMTLRQFLAILLSCTIYGHRLGIGSSLGLLVVFMAVGYQMWLKSQSAKRKQTV